MAKWSAIPCAEVHNTRREWLDADGRFRASVRLECAWEDRFKLVTDLYTCAYGATLPTANTGYRPRAYPHVGSVAIGPNNITAPVMSWIGVDSAQITTIAECYTTDGDAETISYKTTAEVDVQYGRHFNILETLEWDIQAITQTYQQFEWLTTPLVAGELGILGELEAPVHTYPIAILTRDFIGLGLPEPNASLTPDIKTLLDCVGKTNKGPYTSQQLQRTFNEGTLLMLEPEVRPSTDMQNVWNSAPGGLPNNFGSIGFSVKVRFQYKQGGGVINGVDYSVDTHNLFWRPMMKQSGGGTDRGGWDGLRIKDPQTSTFSRFKPFEQEQLINDHWLINGEKPLPAL